MKQESMPYWKKAVYQSRRWKNEVRPAVIRRDKAICYFCGKLIKGRLDVHHLIELTEKNYQDPHIAFGLDNLVCAHKKCHDIHHHRFSAVLEKETIVDDELNIDYERRM